MSYVMGIIVLSSLTFIYLLVIHRQICISRDELRFNRYFWMMGALPKIRNFIVELLAYLFIALFFSVPFAMLWAAIYAVFMALLHTLCFYLGYLCVL